MRCQVGLGQNAVTRNMLRDHMQIPIDNTFLIRQHLAWILEKIRYMEVIGDLTDEQAHISAVSGALEIGDVTVVGDISDEPIWTKKERKYLQRMRNRFGHGHNVVNENEGVLIVATRQKRYRYTLAKLMNECSNIKSLVEDRFGAVVETWTECPVCGDKAYRDDVLECGHVDYSGLDLSQPVLARKPHNGILRMNFIIGRLDEMDMTINRRSRAVMTIDGFEKIFGSRKNRGNLDA